MSHAPIHGPIEWRRFNARYGPEAMAPLRKHSARIVRTLSARLGHRRVLGCGLTYFPRDGTLWWFEQTLLAVMLSAGWEVWWTTNSVFQFDDARFDRLPGQRHVIRVSPDAAAAPEDLEGGPGHVVVALMPNDLATRAARSRGLPLVTFAIKKVHDDEPELRLAPPPGSALWHGFAGSTDFTAELLRKVNHLDQFRLQAAPFPACRYYFPIRPVTPSLDALVLGSTDRDHRTVFEALRRLGGCRVAALCNPPHVEKVQRMAKECGLPLRTFESCSHVDFLALIERARVVLNPIVPPSESHYSLSVPLAIGRPIVATDLPSTRPFRGPGVRLAPQGDVSAWAEHIAQALTDARAGLPHPGALRQGEERHDAEVFFASALLQTLA